MCKQAIKDEISKHGRNVVLSALKMNNFMDKVVFTYA